MIVYWVDRSGGAAFTARAAMVTAALVALGQWPDRFYADSHEQGFEWRRGLKDAIAEMLYRQVPDVLAIPRDQFFRLPKSDQGWIVGLLAGRGHRVQMLDSQTSADKADGSARVLTSERDTQMLLLDDETTETTAFTFEARTAAPEGPMMDEDGGREGDGTEDSGGKHGGGGSDTNDNKDDGHIPAGDKDKK